MSDNNRTPLRRAEFITPPNTLKMKAGSGGLDAHIIEEAQRLIEESDVDFLPIGQRYLTALQEGMRMTESRRGDIDDEALIATMLYPAMQLKANGGMFGYPLVTTREPNTDAMDIVNGFSNALQAILLLGETASEISEHGSDLSEALDEACKRYFEKYP
jgi:hypothetical protein